MRAEFLVILFLVYTVGIFARKYLKGFLHAWLSVDSRFLSAVLITSIAIQIAAHRVVAGDIPVRIRVILLLVLFAAGAIYLFWIYILPVLWTLKRVDPDFSPEYEAFRKEEDEKKRFLDAVLRGDIDTVKRVLEASPERINMKGPDAEDLAACAFKRGRHSMSEFLKQFENNLNSSKKLFIEAIIDGDFSASEEIVGRDGNMVKVPLDGSGMTALHLAVERGNAELAAFLIDKGADIDARDREGAGPLHYAAAIGHLAVAALLVEKGAQVSASDDGSAQPIHEAAMSGNVAVARLLLDHGADPNYADDVLGWTPLYYAEYYDRREMVDFLLSRGATLSVSDLFGRAPKNAGCAGDSVSAEVAKALEKKRKVDELIAAMTAGDSGLTAALLKEEPALANECSGGMPILHVAAKICCETVVRVLLEKGAKVEIEDNRGYTALSYVIFAGFEKSTHGEMTAIIRLLLDYGADPNHSVASMGFSPLHFAVHTDNIAAAQILIDRGADININIRHTGTPLYWAECRGSSQMVKLLKTHGARK